MTQQTEPDGNGKKVYYTPTGLTSYVTDLSTTPKTLVKYEYNERGERTKKISYNPTTGAVYYTTWYVNDGSGNNLSIYDNNSTAVLQKEIPIYGSSRVGVCYKTGTTFTYTYEIKDHLGNVRATV